MLTFMTCRKNNRKRNKKNQGSEIKAKNDEPCLNAKELAVTFKITEVSKGSNSLCVFNGTAHHFLNAFLSRPIHNTALLIDYLIEIIILVVIDTGVHKIQPDALYSFLRQRCNLSVVKNKVVVNLLLQRSNPSITKAAKGYTT